MDLDKLKANWQKESEFLTQNNIKNMEQLNLILNGKTYDLITSLRKKYEKIIGIMLGGMLLTVLFMPLITDGFTFPGSINGFVKMMAFYLILIIFYWMKFRSINNLELSENIRERIQQLLKMLKKSLRLEVSFVLLFFAAIIVIGRFVFGKGLQDLDDRGFLISIPLSILFTSAMIFLIFRRHKTRIVELEKYLKEFE
jgi:hypothetical protein